MISTLLKPLMFVGRTFNTAANVYLAGQLGWWAYKEVRTAQKEKLKAVQLRDRFVAEYVAEHGKEPADKDVALALRSYNAVEHPYQERVKNLLGLGAKGEVKK